MGKDAPLGASLGHRNNQMRFGAEAFGQREDTARGEKRASGWSRGQHPPWRGGGQAWLCGRLCSRRPQPRASPLQPYRCLQTALHHEAPSHMRPRAMRRQVPAAGPALVQGGLYRCWETPARSGSVLLAPELLLDVHGALLAPGRAGSPLPWGCVRAETGPSPGGHWGQGGRSASSPASPAGQAPGSSVKTP